MVVLRFLLGALSRSDYDKERLFGNKSLVLPGESEVYSVGGTVRFASFVEQHDPCQPLIFQEANR
ncbi:hypothetical protein Pla52o_46500 [Novipirellula galeiformis]|uniref:Uncharacterized protein n=1 Tax=Novipirellula galeiformis TaxID=2528004 RepID=A0A5C6C9T7_9BACT|nr:hypothetical protein Pla52o_46500 [Novipirellula galeiformis]